MVRQIISAWMAPTSPDSFYVEQLMLVCMRMCKTERIKMISAPLNQLTFDSADGLIWLFRPLWAAAAAVGHVDILRSSTTKSGLI